MVAPLTKTFEGAAPTALNVGVLMKDLDTTKTEFTVKKPAVRIQVIQHVEEPATGKEYILKLIRDGKELRRWRTHQLKAGLERPYGFPVDISGDDYQLELVQTSGALTGLRVDVTFETDLR